MNNHGDSGDLCDSGEGGQARYIPPHLRSGGGPGNNNSVDSEQNNGGGNRNYNNRDFRDKRDYNNRDFRNNDNR